MSNQLKHSNSSTSLNTISNVPMWDSSDMNRLPPPLPPHPDSPVSNPSPTRPSQIFGSLRSRTGSPVRPSLKPAMTTPEQTQHGETMQLLLKILDVLKDVDTTSKQSEITVRSAEKQVDSLFRRSKDNAVDLVSLRDKIYSSEILLSHQLQDIHDMLLTVINTPKSAAQAIAHSEEYKAQIQRLQQLIEANEIASLAATLESGLSKHHTGLDSLNNLILESDTSTAERLDVLLKHVQSLDQQLKNGVAKYEPDLEQAMSELTEIKKLIKQQGGSNEVIRAINEHQSAIALENKDSQMVAVNVEALLAAIKQSQIRTQESISKQTESMNRKISSLHDGMLESNKLMSENSEQKSSGQLSTFLAQINLQLDACVKSLASNKSSDTNVLTAFKELQTLIITRSDSSFESTIQEHEKLDQIMKNIGELSSNISPLSVLPEIHASFMESSSQLNSYLGSAHSGLMAEVDSLRQEKMKLTADLSALESVVKSRTEQLERLEERANKFQQKLVDHVLQKPTKQSMGLSDQSKQYNILYQKSKKPSLEILDESASGDEPNLTNVTNAKSYGALTRNISTDTSRSMSGTSTGNRRISWSKKIGTMFSVGKENDLVIPKRGVSRKGERSFSERL
ncbi:hypothetical protein V1512DRAFT_207547 [Lipomyces arxii]|uniref:uncharacterized protein n=1 Tax=Lipomyces arxii TaxID=56418 RepID=UPI0034CF88B6